VKSKNIYIRKNDFKKNEPHLTTQMIDTLLEAIEKQKKGIPFGPENIKGSMVALISRGLVTRQNLSKDGQPESQWYISHEAFSLLKILGIDV
jgi:hypothetical protein